MIDELNEMTRSNPVAPEQLRRAVAVDRQELFEMLEADSGQRRERRLFAVTGNRFVTRAGYVGAMVAAAAAVVGVVMVGPGDPSELVDVADTVNEQTPITPLVVEGDVDEGEALSPTSTVPSVQVSAPDGQDGAELSSDSQSEPQTGSQSESQPDSQTGSQSGTQEDSDTTTVTDTDSNAQGGDDGATPVTRTEGPFDRSLDLLVLHFDHSNRDDGHAAMAAREIATAFDLQPHVVSGTYGADFAGYAQPLDPVMKAAWGDQWVNAGADRAGALNNTVDRWLATLDAGGRVWVAEGGVSDFTAEVIVEIQRRRPRLDTTGAIHVVQHARRNESQSSPASLQLVKNATAYELIDDGNSKNATADLNGTSSGFEAAALAGPHGSAWAVAFESLPAAELDFSDTVEVLHILGIDTDEVADADGFVERFLR